MRFPWKLFIRWTACFWVGAIVLLVAAGVWTGWDIETNTVVLLVALCILGTGIIAWNLRPLGRAIRFAQLLTEVQGNSAFFPGEDDDWMSGEEPGEWGELESVLYRIRTGLSQNSERLARERVEIQTLMSGISDAVVSVDSNGKPLFFNSRFAVLFGGKDFTQSPRSIGEIFRSQEVQDLFRSARDFQRVQNGSFLIHTVDENQPRYFSVGVAPLGDSGSSGEQAVLGIFHDVTELKLAEQIRIDFVANVSHELRTPLTSIKGYTEVVLQDIKSRNVDEAVQHLEKVKKNTDRLLSLVNDLLDLSSLESGQEIQRSMISVRDLTERVITQLEPIRSSRGHTVETTYETESLQGDQRRLEQVLTNLIENALKYTPDGSRIAVRWEKREDFVLLRILDNGPGIPVEHHSRLFERFYRVDRARTREAGGTGLGLAIVKHIVQRHGGTVEVRNPTEGGTEFLCTFKQSAY